MGEQVLEKLFIQRKRGKELKQEKGKEGRRIAKNVKKIR